MNNVISEISPINIQKIHDCVVGGFANANAYIKNSASPLSKRSMASIVRDHIISHVRLSFDDNIFEKTDGFIALKIGGIIIRFKKLNQKLQAGNIPTSQSRKFSNQLNILGVSSFINLNAGYVLDNTGSKIKHIYLTYPNGQGRNKWVLNIGDYLQNSNSIPDLPIIKAIEELGHLQVTVKKTAKQKRCMGESANG